MKSPIFAEALILEILRDVEDFGANMIERMYEKSEANILIAQGSLYPKLEDLVTRGLIVQTSREMPEFGGRPREYYKLTKAGEIQADINRKIIGAMFGLEIKKV